jgi:hypothetical protein
MKDMISTIGRIERFSSHSLRFGSKKVLERLSALSESMKKRAGNMYYDSSFEDMYVSLERTMEESKIIVADTMTVFAVDSTTNVIKEILYKTNGISADSPVWGLLEAKEEIYALNAADISGRPRWIPFRLPLLVSRAEIKHIPLVVDSNVLKMPFLTVRITSDLEEAITNPCTITVCKTNIGGRVYSDRHKH